jgi:hypothetical protein
MPRIPKIKYSIPRKTPQGRPIPAPRTRQEMLKQQLGTPEAVAAVRRMRPDLVQADDLTVVETILRETQGGPVAAAAVPPTETTPTAASRFAFPSDPIRKAGVSTSTIRLLADEPVGRLELEKFGQQNMFPREVPELARYAPPPPVDRPLPKPKPPKEPLPPLAEWGSGVAKHTLPSETELAIQARELSGVRDSFQAKPGTSYSAEQEDAVLRSLANPREGGNLSVRGEDLTDRPMAELYSLAKTRLAPEEFARMVEQHQRWGMEMENVDPETFIRNYITGSAAEEADPEIAALGEMVRQDFPAHRRQAMTLLDKEIRGDLEFRVGSSKSVKGSPELDIDQLLDASGEDVTPELRDQLRRLYYEGDPDGYDSAPGGRAKVRDAKLGEKLVVSPMARSRHEPIEPGLADDVYNVERQEFLHKTAVTRDDLPVLAAREKEVRKALRELAGSSTIYQKDATDEDVAARAAALRTPSAKKLLAELGEIHAAMKSVDDEIAGAATGLDRLRESGFLSPRVTGEFVEGEHAGPQPGKTYFPFEKGAKAAVKIGNKFEEVDIVHTVPTTRERASKEELRATQIEQGHLRNAGVPGKERQVKGPMPTFFNWPRKVEEVPSSGTGFTQAYVKRSGRGKPDETTVWTKRTLENPPVVRVRRANGEEFNIPGEALFPAARVHELNTRTQVETQTAALKAKGGQYSFDFETGGNQESRLAAETRQLAAQLPKRGREDYQVLDPKADAYGKIRVRKKLKHGWGDVQHMPVEEAQKRGILDPELPVQVRTAASGPVQIPDVGTEPTPTGVAAKRFPGILRPGDEVVYKGQRRVIEDVRPRKDKKIELVFKSGVAGVLGGTLSSLFGDQPESLEELEGLELSTAGIRWPWKYHATPAVDPKIRKVAPAPDATPNPESKLPWSTQINELIFEDKAKVFAGAHWGDRYGNSKLIPGGTHDPATNPAFMAQSLLEGGGHMPEAYIKDFQAIMAPVLDHGAGPLLRDVVNYHRMGIAWDRVQEKVAEGKARYTKLLREGRDLDADRVLADIQDMEDKIAKSEVVPEGYTPELIQQRLQELEAATPPEQWQLVQQGLEGLYGLTRRLLDDAKVNGGIIDEQAYNTYVGRGGYLPVHRLLSEYDPEAREISTRPGASDTIPTTTTRMNLGDEVEISQELRGSSRLLQDPIKDITGVINGVTNEIARNQLAKATVQYYLKHGAEPEMQKKFGNFYVMRLVPGPQSPPPAGKGYIQYLDNGKPVTVEVDQEFAAAAKVFRPEVNARVFGQGFKTFRMWGQMFAATLNPAFAAAQVVKDPGSVLLTGRLGKYQNQSRPLHAFQLFMTSFFGNYVKTVGRTAVRAVEGRAAALDFDRTADRVLGKFLPGWEDYNNSPVHSRPLGTIVPPEEMALGGMEAIRLEKGLKRKIPKTLMVATQYLNNALMAPLESATKYTGRQLLLERGYSPNEANYRGRKFIGTPDWNQKGTINTTETAVGRLPDWVMFIVPSLSGLQRFGQSLKEDPMAYAKAATYGSAALAAFYGYNSQFVDSQGVREMDKIPDNEWFENFIFILDRAEDPETLGELKPYVVSTGAERNPYIKIPMPVELSNILRPILLAMREVKDQESGQNNYSAGQALADAVGPLIPGGAGIDTNDPLSVIDSVVASLNPIPRGIYEKATGRQAFTRSPIVGTRVEANIPAYERTLRTHPTFAAIGRKLEISPDQLQHTVGTLLGPYSELLAGVAKPLVAEPQDDPLGPLRTGGDALAQTPILGPTLRRFTGTGIADQQMMNARSQFYRIREQTEAAAATISSLSARDPEELVRMLGNRQDLVNLAALNQDVNNLSRMLSELDRTRELVVRDSRMAPGEKQQQLQLLWNTERELFREIGTVIRAWEENGLMQQ